MNPFTRSIVATASACILASGCGRAPDSASPPLPDSALPPLGMIVPVTWSAPEGKENPLPGIDQGTAYSLGTNFVLWSDRVGGIVVSRSGNSEVSECHGSLFGPKGRHIEFRCEIKGGKGGETKVDGITYDLANGGLLAVSTQDEQVRVKQLKRDLTTLKFEQDVLAAFARNDGDLIAFFTRPANGK